MIKPSSIQTVKDRLDIVSIVGHFIKLDRNNKACCPFHTEKTPNFSVDAKKEIFKCFGCGEGGDAIAFVMKHEKLSFIEAIKKIADIIGVQVEYEEIRDAKKCEGEKSLRERMDSLLDFAIETYSKQLWNLDQEHPARKYLHQRKLTQNDIVEWQLGWAGTDWRLITPIIINKNLYTPAEKLGIVKRSKNDHSNYDAYRSRLIIPIQDHHGKYIGLGGRYIKIDAVADEGKDYPKYINPLESELYNKSRVLYGLSRAIKAINELKFAYLVEGYPDVIMMHKGGHQNTVATCGTSLTDAQCKLLSHFTNHVCILRDSDTAGINAAKKDLFILLRNCFKVSIITLPNGADPDSYVAEQMSDEIQEDFIATLPACEDAVFWHVQELVEESKEDTYKTGIVKQETIHLLSQIGNSIIRTNYLHDICKKYKWKATELQKELNTKAEGKK
jgi:DNA primase